MCKHYTPPQKPFNATSASRRENVHIKTRLGKLAQMCGRLRVGKGFLHECSIGRSSHVFGL
jgi:hypothetical protein